MQGCERVWSFFHRRAVFSVLYRSFLRGTVWDLRRCFQAAALISAGAGSYLILLRFLFCVKFLLYFNNFFVRMTM